MSKKLIVAGSMLLILTAGLSGCSETIVEPIDISTLSANPENYVGKKISVEGTCHDYSKKIFDDNGQYFFYISDMKLNGKYKITGIVMFINEVYFINVSDAKTL